MKNLEELCDSVKKMCKAQGVDFLFMTENDIGACNINTDEELRRKWNLIK